MSDPAYTSDSHSAQPLDAQDWPEPKTPNIARMLALFILPSIFVLIAIFAVFWGLTHRKKPVVPVAPVAAVSAPVTADKDAQIARLQAQIQALQAQRPPEAAASVTPTQPLYSTDPTALSQLSVRLDRVEANQRALAKAAAAAFAARTLQQATRTQRPFLSELAAVETGLDDPSLASALRPYAEKGVPSDVSLAIAFPDAAAKANIAAKTDGDDNSLIQKISHALGTFISIRRTDNPNGKGTEAILHSAEVRLNNGDLKGALAYLNTLSPAAQKALSPWLDQARARVLVDDMTQRIAETTLNRLNQATGDTQPNGGVL